MANNLVSVLYFSSPKLNLVLPISHSGFSSPCSVNIGDIEEIYRVYTVDIQSIYSTERIRDGERKGVWLIC